MSPLHWTMLVVLILLLPLLQPSLEIIMPIRKRPAAAAAAAAGKTAPAKGKAKAVMKSVKTMKVQDLKAAGRKRKLPKEVSSDSDDGMEESSGSESIDNDPVLSDDDVRSDELIFYDADDSTLAAKFEQFADLLLPGRVIVTKHSDDQGFIVTYALFLVLDVMRHKDGVVIEASFAGASKKAPPDIQNIKQGSDYLLFLRRTTHDSQLLKDRPDLVPVSHWKSCYLDQLHEKWTTFGMRSNPRDHSWAAGIKKRVAADASESAKAAASKKPRSPTRRLEVLWPVS